MKNLIKQCRVSNSVILFKWGFLKRWNLNEYADQNEPAIFVGIYSQEDLLAIINHKTKCIVLPCGADYPNINIIKHLEHVVFLSTYDNCSEHFKKLGVNFIQRNIPLKSYDMFKPTPLGDKIYVYNNNSSNGALLKYGVHDLQPAINYFSLDMFIFGTQGNSIEYCIENYYSKSFLNIQLNPMAGYTSTLEMAHMGRRSISNVNAPFCINYHDNSKIISIIDNEIKNKTLDNSVFDYIYNSNDWLIL